MKRHLWLTMVTCLAYCLDPVVDANGVQHVKATHETTFADGSSFITSDQEIAIPTETAGPCVLTGIMNITSGT